MAKNDNVRGLIFLMPLFIIMLLLISIAERITITREYHDEEPIRDTLYKFDPNTATFEELVRLGVPRISAAQIIRKQKRGGRFIIKEDFAAVYGISDSVYHRLEPYLDIDEKYTAEYYSRYSRYSHYSQYPKREKPKIVYTAFRIDTVGPEFMQTIGFSPRQAEVFLNYRDMTGGFYSIEEVGKCYIIDDALRDTLEKYIIFPEKEEVQPVADRFPVDINSADSATLCTVYGIGPTTAGRIVRYRKLLGGYACPEQLVADRVVFESNFEKILPQICCDTCKISKIDINFAPLKSMESHPYISKAVLRKTGNKRQLKGGWSSIEEMIDDNILTREEAERLRPYLRFTRDTTKQ